MTILFALMILAVFLGGVLLWLSGLTVGLRSRSDSPKDEEFVKLRQDRDKLAAEADAALEQASEAQAKLNFAEILKSEAGTETTRVVEEMELVENELTMAAEEIKRLKDENNELKTRGISNELKPSHSVPPPLPSKPPPVPPIPPPIPTSVLPDSDELDSAQAQLDLERVAHRRTLDELAAMKNLLTLKIAESSDPSGGVGVRRDRESAGFKTMSIDTRSQPVSGTEHDRLRQTHDQIAREKDRLETELARANQELQLLKMRQQ